MCGSRPSPGAAVTAACAAVLALSEAATAQTYPSRPVRLIVPNSAGGPMDSITRLVAQRLAENIEQPVVVENRPGGNAILGTELVAKSPADGYTVAMIALSHAVNPALRERMPYDAVKDFTPIGLAASGPMLLTVHPSLPARSVPELVKFARARPGQINCASSGSGSTAHMALALLTHATKIEIVHVPYKGAAQAVTDAVAGHVTMYFGGIQSLLPHAKAGRLRALAVSTARRSVAAPDIPTVEETGIPGYEVSGWFGMAGPARMPPDVVARLSSQLARSVGAPDLQAKLSAIGAEAQFMTPDEFGRYIENELAKWRRVVQTAGIKAD